MAREVRRLHEPLVALANVLHESAEKNDATVTVNIEQRRELNHLVNELVQAAAEVSDLKRTRGGA